MWRSSLVVISLLMIVTGFGCMAASRFLTPGTIDHVAVDYAVDAGVADANDYEGYPNLAKAEKLVDDVDNAHILNQEELRHASERDGTLHGIHGKTTTTNYREAVQMSDFLFGEEGLLSMGLTMLGFGSLTGLAGLMRKRPGDVTGVEMEQAVTSAGGQARDDLMVKQRQFIQLVQGVQAYLDKQGQSEHTRYLKDTMNAAQDTETQIAVASVKKELNL